MAFTWKSPKDIWKGEGICHLTFVVAGRRQLLGELVAEYPDVSRPFYRNLTKIVPTVNERGELDDALQRAQSLRCGAAIRNEKTSNVRQYASESALWYDNVSGFLVRMREDV